MMAEPLISSTDLTKISPAALAVLGNTDVIAVDRDPLGLQRQIVQRHARSDVLSSRLEPAVRRHRLDWRVGLTDNGSAALTDLAPGRTVITTAHRRGASVRRHPPVPASRNPETPVSNSG